MQQNRSKSKNLNQKGLAVTGLTSSTVADDLHTETNGGNSSDYAQKNRQAGSQGNGNR
ncbi:hypothetical protein [Brevibacillus dissolubilis]|uniref:hypothetical protein n=1 Tax=Brevibacillus dissolubilis TaxID=1844116 RepID=UPI00159BE4E4|nr:hypothetical protein [Brevibacillus dissolubilis]